MAANRQIEVRLVAIKSALDEKCHMDRRQYKSRHFSSHVFGTPCTFALKNTHLWNLYPFRSFF